MHTSTLAQFLSVIAIILTFASLSHQSKYIVQDDKNVYIVTFTNICYIDKNVTCSADAKMYTEYKHGRNKNCEDEPKTVTNVTCSGSKTCKCTDKMPSGQTLVFYSDEDCTVQTSSAVVAKEKTCFSMTGPKDSDKYFVNKYTNGSFEVLSYSESNCKGSNKTLVEGAYGECLKFSADNHVIVTDGKFGSSALSLGFSTLVLIASMSAYYIML